MAIVNIQSIDWINRSNPLVMVPGEMAAFPVRAPVCRLGRPGRRPSPQAIPTALIGEHHECILVHPRTRTAAVAAPSLPSLPPARANPPGAGPRAVAQLESTCGNTAAGRIRIGPAG